MPPVLEWTPELQWMATKVAVLWLAIGLMLVFAWRKGWIKNPPE